MYQAVVLFIATGDFWDSDSDPFMGSVSQFLVGSSAVKTECMSRRKSSKKFHGLMHIV